MGIKKLNPVTPGTRFKVALTFDELTASKPYKKLTAPLKKSGGRNNQGKRTMRMIGGGHKRNRKGTPAKGYKTRHPKKPSTKLIIERRKK